MYYKLNTLSFCSNFFAGINDCCKKNFHKVDPKTKSRRQAVHDIKKVAKHCLKVFLGD